MTISDQRYRLRVDKDVVAPMRDGALLRADVYTPEAAGPWPVLIERTPYSKRRATSIALAEQAAASGYIVVVQDIRGRYASDGDFDPFYSPTHGDACITDGYDTVEWAATLPGATGQVGTYGCSYAAWTQWKLAPTRPPHLRAIFAGGMNTDSRDTWPGIFTRDRQLQWALNTLAPDTRQRLDLPGPRTVEEAQWTWDHHDKGKWLWFEPLSELPEAMLGGLARDWRYWLGHHHRDWFDFAARHPEIDAPVFHFTGWYDRFLGGTIKQHQGLVAHGRTERTRRNQKLIIGPWTHGFSFPRQVGVMDYGPTAELSAAGLMTRWFDHWLKERDTGVTDEPPIRFFVMGQNAWRETDAWPLPGTRFVDYFLHSQGAANGPAGDGLLSEAPPADEPPDAYTYDPRDPVMSIYLPSAQFGPGDARVLDHRPDMLVYQTPPLSRAIDVIGPITVTLYAASSARDTDWTARLIDVHPDGLAVNLTEGIVRARHRESWEQPRLLEPGRVYEYQITLQPTANRFQAGHRLRLDISSSDFPKYDRNHNTGRDDWEDAELISAHQIVHHSRQRPSRATLPIAPA